MKQLLLAAGLVAGIGCGDAFGPSVAGLRTDADGYTAAAVGSRQFQVRLTLTYHNAADTSVFLARCMTGDTSPMFWMRLLWPTNSEGAAYDGPLACVGEVPPIVVAAHATRVDTLTLLGPLAFDHATQQGFGALAGEFQIGYGGRWSNDFSIKLPPE